MALIFGEEAIELLGKKHVAIFGAGGVGGYVIEALARSGIGTFTIVDDDRVCLSNLNRQILATRNTVGKLKVDVAEERIKSINPDAIVHKKKVFYLPETASEFDFTQYDYVIDCIDTVTGKLKLIEEAISCNTLVISSMGTGNKVDPTKLKVCDIYETENDPLARVMRRELRKRNVKSLKVVTSTEPAIKPIEDKDSCRNNCICPPETKNICTIRKQVPGSTAFVPSVAGLIIASEVVKDLTGFTAKGRTKMQGNGLLL